MTDPCKSTEGELCGTTLSDHENEKSFKRIISPYVKIQCRHQPLEGPSFSTKRFSQYTQQRANVLLHNLTEFLYDSFDLPALLNETGDILKAITKSAGVVTYTVDRAENEIVQCPRHIVSSRHRVNWKISAEASALAPYVAATKEYIMVEDVLGDARFPEGSGWKGEAVKATICVPVIAPGGDCFAVVELFRTVDDEPYGKIDFQTVIAMTGWMGAAIHQNQQRINIQKQKELNDYLLDVTKNYFSDVVNVEKVLSDIMIFAKMTLGVERGSFYIIDRDSGELVADLFEEAIDDENEGVMMLKKKVKVKMGKDQGIASLVVQRGKLINIKDAYRDPNFNKDVDAKTGLITKAVLCAPIHGSNSVLGVLQLVNKKDGTEFTELDVNILNTISVYCALSLHYAYANKTARNNEISKNIRSEMLVYHMVPCVHDKQPFIEETYFQDIPEDFLSFSWYFTSNEEQIPQLVLHMFSDVIETCQIDKNKFKIFILSVRKFHRNNPYHNWNHAFCVCHCMYCILKRNMDLFTDVEVAGLLIASLCHAMDHRGVTSNFLLMSDDPIAQLYPTSPSENHQFQVTMLVLEGCDILNHLEKQYGKDIILEIKDAIMATNIQTFFYCRSKLVDILEDNVFEYTNVVHRSLMKGILTVTCDLSGQFKTFPVSKLLVKDLYREFYRQGDREKQLGYFPLSRNDKEKQHLIPQDQVQFNTIICLPCCALLVRMLPNTQELYYQCYELREHWREVIALEGKDTWAPEESIVKKD